MPRRRGLPISGDTVRSYASYQGNRTRNTRKFIKKFRNFHRKEEDKMIQAFVSCTGKVGLRDTVYIYTANDKEDNMEGTDLATMMWQAIAVNALDENEVFSMYLSLINIISPVLGYMMVKEIKRCGAEVIEEVWDSGITFDNFLLDEESERLHISDVIVILGYFLILPFKNINDRSYSAFFSARLRALAYKCGSTPQKIRVFIEFQKAEALKARFARYNKLREHIVRFLISQEATNDPTLGVAVYYIRNIISYAEMTFYQIILVTLVRPCSPVLFHPDVMQEVTDFCWCIKQVHEIAFPQFYRFLGPKGEQSKLTPRRFETLYAVSVIIMKERTPSLKNLVGVEVANKNLVTELVALHLEYVSRELQISLTNFTPKVLDPQMQETILQVSELKEISKEDVDKWVQIQRLWRGNATPKVLDPQMQATILQVSELKEIRKEDVDKWVQIQMWQT